MYKPHHDPAAAAEHSSSGSILSSSSSNNNPRGFARLLGHAPLDARPHPRSKVI